MNFFVHPSCMPRRRGFTLVELMIVVAIVSILGMVALPAYMGSLRKSRRAEAVAAISQIQQAQERWRANCPSYTANITTVNNNDCLSTSGLGLTPSGTLYTYSMAASTTTYTVTANAVAGKSQAKDTGCTTMAMAIAASGITQTPAKCWSN